jgi:ribosome-binding protein aMBF1 (putative translation factor)
MRRAVRRPTGADAGNSNSNIVNERLGEIMRERRRQIGLSRQGLADQLAMTKADIRRYEKGRIPFGADMLVAMRIALKVRMGFLTDPITSLVRRTGVSRHVR